MSTTYTFAANNSTHDRVRLVVCDSREDAAFFGSMHRNGDVVPRFPVSEWTADELAYYVEYPAEGGHKSVTLLKPAKVRYCNDEWTYAQAVEFRRTSSLRSDAR